MSNEPEATEQTVTDQATETTETPAAAPAPAQTEKTKRALAVMLEKDRELRVQNQALKLERQQLAQEREQFLRSKNVNDAQLQQFLQNQQQAQDPTAPLNGRLAQLEAELSKMQQRDEQSRFEQAWNEHIPAMEIWLGEQNQKFPLASQLGMHREIVNEQRAHFQAEGTYLSEEEAAARVENSLKPLVDRVKAMVAPPDPENPASELPNLSNSNLDQVNSRAPNKPETLSNEEFVRRFLK